MAMQINRTWSLAFSAGSLPMLVLLFNIINERLGSNPIEAVHIFLGDWALRFLCVTLAITPIQKVTKWKGMSEYRQMFGLFAFFYATLHFLGYVFLDQAGEWQLIVTDIQESPYIWFGLIAYLIIVALALTSPNVIKKRMGKNWKKLHRFIYYAAAAAVIHYFWQLKGNLLQPLFYLTLIALLLGFRLLTWYANRQTNK